MSIVYWEIGNILTLFCTLCIKRHWTLDFYQDRFPTDSVPAALSHLLQCSLALLKIQVSICPISTCGLLAANRAKHCLTNMYQPSLLNITRIVFRYTWSQGVAALATAQASVNVSSARSVHCVQRLAWPLPSNNRIGIDITIIASPELGSSDAD